ncbi:glycoside hydrolase family 16 protein [Modestobacter sp. VKM Ac-2983]|uniref:glycoside hydrolase family 16 protein n=1 Tax=Modestobacter sp. VKM Ac-2983 TaxID=3004137 RepID=UPI0022AB61D2|nr:glycoside hydrolase family 16 protein [Modestobacter sp. VKM Ac-2983]MCZ2803709.1 glycoside hydrolase family 16 protein [Modestobacter sp. VKM Ac-2983]
MTTPLPQPATTPPPPAPETAPAGPAQAPASTPVATAPAATTGGGTAAPKGDLAGWRQVFVDEFNGSSLGSQWKLYSGQPGGSPYGRWDPSHVAVGGGNLTLTQTQQNGEWVAGGLANRTTIQYGKVEMRFRVDAGDEMKYAALLWPADNSWPPEIDFAEDAGGDRSATTGTVHYGSNNTMIGQQVEADFTQWHTIGVEWTPGKVVYTLDGQAWGSTDHPGVSSTPMNLAIQVQPGGCQGGGAAFGCGVGDPAVTSLQVDWVSIWARS